MNKHAYEHLVGIVLHKKAGFLDVVTSVAKASAESYAKSNDVETRIHNIDNEIAENNRAIQQLQSIGSNSIAIRKYVNRNIQLQEEKSKLTSGA